MDKYLTRREKYMYERILAEAQHRGSFNMSRLNASLVILQKIIKRAKAEKAKKMFEQEATKTTMSGFTSAIKKTKPKDSSTISKKFMDYDQLERSAMMEPALETVQGAQSKCPLPLISLSSVHQQGPDKLLYYRQDSLR